MANLLSVQTALAIHHYTQPMVFIAVSIGIIIALLSARRLRDASICAISFVLTATIVLILKHVFAVPRPGNALIKLTDYAFPSSHAALSMLLAVLLAWFIAESTTLGKWSRLFIQLVFFIIAFLVGISRLTLKVHTPLQVAVGFGIGIIVPALVIYVNKKRLRSKE